MTRAHITLPHTDARFFHQHPYGARIPKRAQLQILYYIGHIYNLFYTEKLILSYICYTYILKKIENWKNEQFQENVRKKNLFHCA